MIKRKNDPRTVFWNKSRANSFIDKILAWTRDNEFRRNLVRTRRSPFNCCRPSTKMEEFTFFSKY